MHRAYYPAKTKAGEVVSLSQEESHHVLKVLRSSQGDEVILVDGEGGVSKGTIESLSGKICRVLVQSVEHHSPVNQVTLVFGIPKGQAIDFIVRRAVELGVYQLQPVSTQHSSAVKTWNEDRWKKVVAEVAKQCQLTFFPKVMPPLSLREWLNGSSGRTLVVCDEESREERLPELSGPASLLVGAEGGWSREEVSEFRSLGAKFMGLGPQRLRAETACLVGLALLKSYLGEI